MTLSALFWRRSSWPSRVGDIQGCQAGAAWVDHAELKGTVYLEGLAFLGPLFGGK